MLVDVDSEAAILLEPFDRTPGARRLVAHHLGDDAIIVVHALRGRDAELITLYGRPKIAIRPKLSRESLRWALLHELAEWHLQRIDYRGQDVELVAEALAAALAAPRGAFRDAIRQRGRMAFEQLAFDFTVTQTCAALRVGEVMGQPLVVVSPALVRARGIEIVWPDERTLRRMVKAPPPELRAVTLTDGRGRFALLTEDAA